MKSYQSYAPTDNEISAASLDILDAGGWAHSDHFNELVDQWIDDSTELNYQLQLQEQQHEQV